MLPLRGESGGGHAAAPSSALAPTAASSLAEAGGRSAPPQLTSSFSSPIKLPTGAEGLACCSASQEMPPGGAAALPSPFALLACNLVAGAGGPGTRSCDPAVGPTTALSGVAAAAPSRVAGAGAVSVQLPQWTAADHDEDEPIGTATRAYALYIRAAAKAAAARAAEAAAVSSQAASGATEATPAPAAWRGAATYPPAAASSAAVSPLPCPFTMAANLPSELSADAAGGDVGPPSTGAGGGTAALSPTNEASIDSSGHSPAAGARGAACAVLGLHTASAGLTVLTASHIADSGSSSGGSRAQAGSCSSLTGNSSCLVSICGSGSGSTGGCGASWGICYSHGTSRSGSSRITESHDACYSRCSRCGSGCLQHVTSPQSSARSPGALLESKPSVRHASCALAATIATAVVGAASPSGTAAAYCSPQRGRDAAGRHTEAAPACLDSGAQPSPPQPPGSLQPASHIAATAGATPLPPSTEAMLLALSWLPHNELACSGRRICRAARQAFPARLLRVRPGLPVPYHARHGMYEDPHALRLLAYEEKQRLLAAAAGAGDLGAVVALRGQKPPCPWGPAAPCAAAAGGHLKLLQWLVGAGCPLDYVAALAAAAAAPPHCGGAEVLRWLATWSGSSSADPAAAAAPAPSSASASSYAAAASAVRILKLQVLVAELGCALSGEVLAAALRAGDLHTAAWLRQRGVRPTASGWLAATTLRPPAAAVAVWGWLAEQRAPLASDDVPVEPLVTSLATFAARCGDIACLHWLLASAGASPGPAASSSSGNTAVAAAQIVPAAHEEIGQGGEASCAVGPVMTAAAALDGSGRGGLALLCAAAGAGLLGVVKWLMAAQPASCEEGGIARGRDGSSDSSSCGRSRLSLEARALVVEAAAEAAHVGVVAAAPQDTSWGGYASYSSPHDSSCSSDHTYTAEPMLRLLSAAGCRASVRAAELAAARGDVPALGFLLEQLQAQPPLGPAEASVAAAAALASTPPLGPDPDLGPGGGWDSQAGVVRLVLLAALRGGHLHAVQWLTAHSGCDPAAVLAADSAAKRGPAVCGVDSSSIHVEEVQQSEARAAVVAGSSCSWSGAGRHDDAYLAALHRSCVGRRHDDHRRRLTGLTPGAAALDAVAANESKPAVYAAASCGPAASCGVASGASAAGGTTGRAMADGARRRHRMDAGGSLAAGGAGGHDPVALLEWLWSCGVRHWGAAVVRRAALECGGAAAADVLAWLSTHPPPAPPPPANPPPAPATANATACEPASPAVPRTPVRPPESPAAGSALNGGMCGEPVAARCDGGESLFLEAVQHPIAGGRAAVLELLSGELGYAMSAQAYGAAAHRGDLCTLACLTRLGCPLPPPAAPAPAAAPVAGAGVGPGEAAEAFWSAFLHGGGDHHSDGSRPAGSDQAEGAGSGVLTGDTAGWQLAALKALVEAERGGGSFYIRRQPAPSEPPTDPSCQIPAILQNQQQPAAQAVLFRRLQTEPRRQLRQLHSLQREQVQPLPEPVKWQRSVSLHRDGVAAGAGAADAYGDGRLGQCYSTAVLAAAAAAAGGMQAAAAAAALPGAKEAFGCPLVAVAAGEMGAVARGVLARVREWCLFPERSAVVACVEQLME
eukprot:XP_001694444.1 predicted protein [Chlamydomonas reinhardtii]